MHNSYTPADANEPHNRLSTLLNVAGLVTWLSAMLLAIAGPLLGLHVPSLLIVALVVFSGAFTVLSLPRLIGLGKRHGDSPQHPA